MKIARHIKEGLIALLSYGAAWISYIVDIIPLLIIGLPLHAIALGLVGVYYTTLWFLGVIVQEHAENK